MISFDVVFRSNQFRNCLAGSNLSPPRITSSHSASHISRSFPCVPFGNPLVVSAAAWRCSLACFCFPFCSQRNLISSLSAVGDNESASFNLNRMEMALKLEGKFFFPFFQLMRRCLRHNANFKEFSWRTTKCNVVKWSCRDINKPLNDEKSGSG